MFKSIGMVIGTTGFSEKELLLLKQASKTIPILCAPNMSLGVNKVFAILKEAVKHFDNNYDVEIFEAHHRDKLDAPSGTALKMGSIIADTLGLNPEDSFAFREMIEKQIEDTEKLVFLWLGEAT